MYCNDDVLMSSIDRRKLRLCGTCGNRGLGGLSLLGMQVHPGEEGAEAREELHGSMVFWGDQPSVPMDEIPMVNPPIPVQQIHIV